ncbi:hypothetical protein J5W01_00540 [Akkermansia muciniphila]|uniref:hypothetical protein n=1 Tax=Akkermansia sp. TaxID=1872421 RepID=UPI001C0127EF|nr:hypothetical protein [Candidatus Akkermansia timonensis]MBT9561444.1 hypothetical protein [Candidatus Akkermansia timonensis]MBT9599705.1 hypothetical protein [Akkermansia muciniphila]DAI93483.1 MAG TPA: coat protein [Caudoviricetes sp.]
MALSDAQKVIIHGEVITSLRKALVPLEFLKKDFRMEYASQLDFKNVKTSGEVVENPSSYQNDKENNGDLIKLSLTELHQAWRITPAEKRNGWKLGDLAKTNSIAFANNLHKRIMSLVSASGAKAIGTADKFNKRGCINLSGDIESDEPRLLLTPDYYRAILPENTTEFKLDGGAYGFESIHKAKASVFSEGVVGVAYEGGAIAVGSAIPEIDNELKDDINCELISIDGLAGLTVMFCNWLDRNTRSEWASLGLMFGAKILEPDKVKGYVAAAVTPTES